MKDFCSLDFLVHVLRLSETSAVKVVKIEPYTWLQTNLSMPASYVKKSNKSVNWYKYVEVRDSSNAAKHVLWRLLQTTVFLPSVRVAK